MTTTTDGYIYTRSITLRNGKVIYAKAGKVFRFLPKGPKKPILPELK